MSIVRRALLAGLLLVAAGCGPIEYITVITFEASHAVAAAKGAHADRLAPYEYTAAVEYLHKARELGGFARYHQSVEFGKKARDFGNQAFEMSRGRVSKPATAPVEEKHE
jgi:hypothetical protein